MNKKISLGIAISLVAIGCAITFVLTWTVSLNIYNSKLGTSEKYEGVYAKLREIDTTVRQNYIGSVSDDSLENATINGYISGIGDKYASYIAPSAYYELQQTQSGVILGAGFEAEEDTSGSGRSNSLPFYIPAEVSFKSEVQKFLTLPLVKPGVLW